jgi:hypothetical protein
MTEAQAYDALGWPHEGAGFILPLTGRPDSDYVISKCMCGYGTAAIKGLFEYPPVCPSCGAEQQFIEF